MERLAEMCGFEAGGEEDVLSGVDREGLFRNGGDDVDAESSGLRSAGLRTGGRRGGGGVLFRRRLVGWRRRHSSGLRTGDAGFSTRRSWQGGCGLGQVGKRRWRWR